MFANRSAPAARGGSSLWHFDSTGAYRVWPLCPDGPSNGDASGTRTAFGHRPRGHSAGSDALEAQRAWTGAQALALGRLWDEVRVLRTCPLVSIASYDGQTAFAVCHGKSWDRHQVSIVYTLTNAGGVWSGTTATRSERR